MLVDGRILCGSCNVFVLHLWIYWLSWQARWGCLGGLSGGRPDKPPWVEVRLGIRHLPQRSNCLEADEQAGRTSTTFSLYPTLLVFPLALGRVLWWKRMVIMFPAQGWGQLLPLLLVFCLFRSACMHLPPIQTFSPVSLMKCAFSHRKA